MDPKINRVYLNNAARMFRNIDLVKMETKAGKNDQQCLELVFHKADDSAFDVYGASGRMLKDAITEALDYQYRQYNVLVSGRNMFIVSITLKEFFHLVIPVAYR